MNEGRRPREAQQWQQDRNEPKQGARGQTETGGLGPVLEEEAAKRGPTVKAATKKQSARIAASLS